MSVSEKYAHLPALPADLADRLSVVHHVMARHPVEFAIGFGSAFSGQMDAADDVDLAVYPADGWSAGEFAADVSEQLGSDRIDIVDLRHASPELQVEILRTGRPLWIQDQQVYLVFERLALSRWRDESWWLANRWRQKRSKRMGIDRNYLIRATGELERTASELEKYAGIESSRLEQDLSLRWTVERGLLAGLTLVFQISDHILARRFERFSDTYGGLLHELSAAGVLSEATHTRLRGAAGFRNILVHDYVRIDLGQIAAAVHDAPATFRRFADEIQSWMESADGDDR